MVLDADHQFSANSALNSLFRKPEIPELLHFCSLQSVLARMSQSHPLSLPRPCEKILLAICFFFTLGTANSQQQGVIFGRVTDSGKHPLELVNVALQGTGTGTTSRVDGQYVLTIPANEKLIVVFSSIGFRTSFHSLTVNPGQRLELNMVMEEGITRIDDVSVVTRRETEGSLIRLDPKMVNIIPGSTGGMEAILKTLPGVSSNNELSSQYSVRGGNFDENLVYVNDIEIYRPFLIRSGQQEGLSFVNSDLISSIKFSAGGFEAKYGDKMSSVLDIQYKKPEAFAGSAALSLLGGSVHLEDISRDSSLSHITGIRYKTSKYLLSSTDTQADYNPSFFDFQTYVSLKLSPKSELNFLGYFANNQFTFERQTRETSFGTLSEALKLKIYFEGSEIDEFTTFMGAVSFQHQPSQQAKHTLTLSAFRTQEEETFDILGQYFLNQLDKNLGSDKVGDSLMNIGIGSFLDHARNYLTANVMNAEYRASSRNNGHGFQWGLKIQTEQIEDQIREWKMLDSAGYSLPYTDTLGHPIPYSNGVSLYETIRGDVKISSNRFTAFFQDTYRFEWDSIYINLTGGVRANYWDLNRQFLVSPRLVVNFIPNWKRPWIFRIAAGNYNQPPFYRELRNTAGELLKDVKAQKSYHLVIGGEYEFRSWGRPFKLFTEAYYKYMDDLIPYEVDNVRIRYYARNNAEGYALGLDFKVNGEFVPGIDSWASLSVMQTRERIDWTGDTLVSPDLRKKTGWIERPTDQLVTFGLFFQDYLPNNPSYKMSLNLLLGTGLPFAPPNKFKTVSGLRMPPYRRVDIGFSKILKSEVEDWDKGFFRHIKSAWVSLEVFNLLDINNTISYVWVADIRNREYAVPNYLTSRRLNLRLIINF
jgi:hypothetical protein